MVKIKRQSYEQKLRRKIEKENHQS